MMNNTENKDKILKTFKIAGYAKTIRAVGNTEIVFEHSNND